jgi:hypothetical protein
LANHRVNRWVALPGVRLGRSLKLRAEEARPASRFQTKSRGGQWRQGFPRPLGEEARRVSHRRRSRCPGGCLLRNVGLNSELREAAELPAKYRPTLNLSAYRQRFRRGPPKAEEAPRLAFHRIKNLLSSHQKRDRNPEAKVAAELLANLCPTSIRGARWRCCPCLAPRALGERHWASRRLHRALSRCVRQRLRRDRERGRPRKREAIPGAGQWLRRLAAAGRPLRRARLMGCGGIRRWPRTAPWA